MKILSQWLRSYLPALNITDRQLADNLTLRGIAVEGVFDLEENNGSLPGSWFDMDITTNRVDAMNHYGIAREAAAIYNVPLLPLDISLPEATPARQPYPIRIEAPDLCGRFTARVLRNVTIAPATAEIAQYFSLLGQKQISNAVDATNFVTLAMGHPTHAFDLDQVQGALIVRRAAAGEKLLLLDGTERTLVADDLVVADERAALALAGVMGGWSTRITPETKNILVEAAWFDPASVRRSSRRHGLHTDASHRFERGADFAAPPLASALVARLILAAGGQLEGDLIDVIVPEIAARILHRPSITLDLHDVTRILGRTLENHPLDAPVVERYLNALGCRVSKSEHASHGTEFSVQLPSWRLDLERDIDLIEEIARLHGYNHFANTLPAFSGTVVELPTAQKSRLTRSKLLAAGYTETVFSTFCSEKEATTFATASVALGNPLSEEAGHLRPSLLPGMLAMLAHNLNHGVDSLRLFEMGTVFSGSTQKVDERFSLAIGATGLVAVSPHTVARAFNFYDIKGIVEDLLAGFSGAITFAATSESNGALPAWLHPGRAARVIVDGKTIGHFGQLSDAETSARKLKQPVFVGELDLALLFAHALGHPAVQPPSRFPAVVRTFSFIFPESIQWQHVAATLDSLAIADMRAPEPLEIFRDPKGKTIARGSYSLLVRTVFQSQDRTLGEEEIQSAWERVIAALTALGGVIRDGAGGQSGATA